LNLVRRWHALLTAAGLVIGVGSCGVAAASQSVESADCSQPPIVVTAIAPAFPDVPHRARISGVVVVAVHVDPAGRVASAQTVPEKPPNLNFVDAAVAAAKRWEFNPAAGCDSRQAELKFDFKLPMAPAPDAGAVFRPPYTVEIIVEAVQVITTSTGTP
jgi:TonB family protein